MNTSYVHLTESKDLCMKKSKYKMRNLQRQLGKGTYHYLIKQHITKQSLQYNNSGHFTSADEKLATVAHQNMF